MDIDKKKVLIVCPFTAGSCGVFTRAKNDALALKEMGYEVMIFSSNATKGSKEIAARDDEIEGIKIRRFPYKKLGGESFMMWDYKDEALAFMPDYIFAHNYRHIHTTKAIKIAEILKGLGHQCYTILITHAPFIKDNSTRSGFAAAIVKMYDKFIGPRTINKFDAIVRISDWEEPYLLALGADKNKIWKIPNVVPNEFFTIPRSDPINKSVLFLGRVAPVKNILFILDLAKTMPDFNFSIVGPCEEKYLYELSLKHPIFPNNVSFYPGIYDLDKKIKAFDNHKYFILPSIREALPTSMVEAMARGKICISTNTDGGKELIEQNINGYICLNNNPEEAKKFILLNEQIPLDKDMIINSVKRNNSITILKEKYQQMFNMLNTKI